MMAKLKPIGITALIVLVVLLAVHHVAPASLKSKLGLQ